MKETELERLIVRLMGDSSSYTKMLDKAQVDLKKTVTSVQQSAKQVEGFGDKLTQFATSTATAIATIAGAMKTVTDFSDFDLAMTETFAKMGLQTDKLRKRLEDLAKTMSTSGEVTFSPTELARGYEELASAGLDAERSMASLPVVAKFAQAGAFSLSVAVAQLTGAMASMGKMSDDPLIFAQNMARFSDVIVGVGAETTTSAERVARAMSADAAVAAKEYGMSLEELGAVLGVYAKNNKQAEEAGNLTGRALRLMTSSFVANKDEWLKLNINIADSKGNFIKFADAIGLLENALKGLSGVQKVETLERLGFAALSQKAILPLLGWSKELKRQEEIYKKVGTTAETASIQMMSFAAQVKLLKNQVTVAAIEVGQRLAPALLYIMSVVKGSIAWWNSLGDTIKTITTYFAVFAVTMMVWTPLMAVFTGLKGLVGSVFAPLAKIIPALAAAFMLLVNPIRLAVFWFNPLFIVLRNVVAVAAAAIVAIQRSGGIEEAWRGVEEALIGVWEWLRPIGEALAELGGTIIRSVIDAFIQMGAVMLLTLEWIASKISIDWKLVQDVVIAVIQAIDLTIRNLGNIFKILIEAIKGLIPEFKAAEKGTVTWGERIRGAFQIALNSVYAFAGGLVGGLYLAFKMVTGAATSLLSIFSSGEKSTRDWGETITAAAGIAGILAVGLGVLALAFKFLYLQQIIGIAVTIASAVAWGAYKTVMALVAAGIFIVTNFTTIMSVSIILLKIAVIALTASFLGLFVILIPLKFALVAVFATLGGLVIAPIVGAIWGAYKAGEALLDTLRRISQASSAFAVIGGMFREWGDVISLIVRAMRVDMELAWEFVTVGGRLAVAHLKALWPSLWKFIKDGFAAVAKVTALTFEKEFRLARANMLVTLFSMGRTEQEVAKKRAELLKEAEDIYGPKLKDASNEFDAAVKELNNIKPPASPEITAIGKEIDALKKKLEDAEWEKQWEDMQKALDLEESTDKVKKAAEEAAKAAADALAKTGEEGKKTAAAIERVEQALYSSAEAATRMQAYTEAFFDTLRGENTFKATSVFAPAYSPDTEWAANRAKEEEAEDWATKAGHNLVTSALNFFNPGGGELGTPSALQDELDKEVKKAESAARQEAILEKIHTVLEQILSGILEEDTGVDIDVEDLP